MWYPIPIPSGTRGAAHAVRLKRGRKLRHGLLPRNHPRPEQTPPYRNRPQEEEEETSPDCRTTEPEPSPPPRRLEDARCPPAPPSDPPSRTCPPPSSPPGRPAGFLRAAMQSGRAVVRNAAVAKGDVSFVEQEGRLGGGDSGAVEVYTVKYPRGSRGGGTMSRRWT